jgi:hypothetical protein
LAVLRRGQVVADLQRKSFPGPLEKWAAAAGPKDCRKLQMLLLLFLILSHIQRKAFSICSLAQAHVQLDARLLEALFTRSFNRPAPLVGIATTVACSRPCSLAEAGLLPRIGDALWLNSVPDFDEFVAAASRVAPENLGAELTQQQRKRRCLIGNPFYIRSRLRQRTALK